MKPSWYASAARLLWFMQGVSYAAILVIVAWDDGWGLPMAYALAAASLPATTVQAWRMGKDVAREAKARAKGVRA